MRKEPEKRCKCCYRIKLSGFACHYKVLYRNEWIATFDSWVDANNFIDMHIEKCYENDMYWYKKQDEPMKVVLVKETKHE